MPRVYLYMSYVHFSFFSTRDLCFTCVIQTNRHTPNRNSLLRREFYNKRKEKKKENTKSTEVVARMAGFFAVIYREGLHALTDNYQTKLREMSAVVYSYHWVRISFDEKKRTNPQSTKLTPATSTANSIKSKNDPKLWLYSTRKPANK